MPLHGFSMLKLRMKGKQGSASARFKTPAGHPAAGACSGAWLSAFRDFAFSLDLYVSSQGVPTQTRALSRGFLKTGYTAPRPGWGDHACGAVAVPKWPSHGPATVVVLPVCYRKCLRCLHAVTGTVNDYIPLHGPLGTRHPLCQHRHLLHQDGSPQLHACSADPDRLPLPYPQGYTPSLIVSDFKTVISLSISLVLLSAFLTFVVYTTYVWVLAPVGQSGARGGGTVREAEHFDPGRTVRCAGGGTGWAVHLDPCRAVRCSGRRYGEAVNFDLGRPVRCVGRRYGMPRFRLAFLLHVGTWPFCM